MSAQALFEELDEAGVRLSLAGDDLRFQTRPGVSVAQHSDRIRAHKPALIVLLRNRESAEATTPPTEWDGTLCPGCRWPALCAVLGPRGPRMAGWPCSSWPAWVGDMKGVA